MKRSGKLESEFKQLTTEQANPSSTNLDLKSSLELAQIINNEDAKVAAAVERVLPQVAEAIDVIAGAIQSGGRLIYVGAGTSGRIAALDAAECPPTFSTAPKTVQFVIAGGAKALGTAADANEDSRKLGEREIAKKKPGEKDVVVGIAASGHTPFTVAAVNYARRKGANTVAVTCSPGSSLEKTADLAIVVDVGPEVISGSTRMKAGTAQKMVLNMISTGTMVRLGRVYGNLMVNAHLTNSKLQERGIAILQQAAGVDRAEAQKTLKTAKSIATALVMLKAKIGCSEAEKVLKSAKGHVRQAIAAAKNSKADL